MRTERVNKTGRKRGAAISVIREFIKNKDTFSHADFPNRAQAKNLLRHLCNRGEIKQISPSGKGKHSPPTIYAKPETFPDAPTFASERRSQVVKHIDAGLEHLRATIAPGERLSAAEIAAACGISHQAVQQYEARALRKLREMMDDDLKNEFMDTIDRIFHASGNPRFTNQTRITTHPE